MTTISRQTYASLYGPAEGDRFRLADTSLIAQVEQSNRENGSLLEQARDSARELQLLSQELGGAVGRFHIDGKAIGGRGAPQKPASATPAGSTRPARAR